MDSTIAISKGEFNVNGDPGGLDGGPRAHYDQCRGLTSHLEWAIRVKKRQYAVQA